MRVTKVKDWDPLNADRPFLIGPSYRGDLEESVGVVHSCVNSSCDICRARQAGFPLVASDLLSGATEVYLLGAVERAHRFNRTFHDEETALAAEWKRWLDYWGEAEADGRIWQCLACDAWNWDSESCRDCYKPRPVWKLTHAAYCGMVTLRETFEDPKDGRVRCGGRAGSASTSSSR